MLFLYFWCLGILLYLNSKLLLRHDDFIKVIIEGKIEGRRKRGRPRRAYMEQLKENIEVESYRELKEKAENRTEWKLLHRQEPSS